MFCVSCEFSKNIIFHFLRSAIGKNWMHIARVSKVKTMLDKLLMSTTLACAVCAMPSSWRLNHDSHLTHTRTYRHCSRYRFTRFHFNDDDDDEPRSSCCSRGCVANIWKACNNNHNNNFRPTTSRPMPRTRLCTLAFRSTEIYCGTSIRTRNTEDIETMTIASFHAKQINKILRMHHSVSARHGREWWWIYRIRNELMNYELCTLWDAYDIIIALITE